MSPAVQAFIALAILGLLFAGLVVSHIEAVRRYARSRHHG